MINKKPLTRRAEVLLFILIIAIGAGARLWCFFHNHLQEGDAGNYLEVGRNLALGRGYVTYAKWDFYGEELSPVIHPEGNRQPLLPFVVAALFKSGAEIAKGTSAVTILVSLAALWILYTLLKRWFTPAVALAGLAVTALEPAFLWFSVRVQTEAYFTLLFFAAMALTADFKAERPSLLRALAAGIVLGLSYLCRLNGALLIIAFVVAVIIVYRHRGIFPAAVAVAAFAAVAAPWWIRNAHTFGNPFYSQAKFFVVAKTFDDVWAIKRTVPSWQGFFAAEGITGIVWRLVRGIWRGVEPFLLGNLHFNEPYEGAPLAAFVALAPFAFALLTRKRAFVFPGVALALHILAFAIYGQGLYRYFLPFYLLVIPLGLAGATRAFSLLPAGRAWPKVLLVALLLLPFFRPLAKTLKQDDAEEYKQVFAVADWIRLGSKPDDVVATWPRVIELLYYYDRPTVYYPTGDGREIIWLLNQYNVRYAVAEPLALAMRPGLTGIWTMGPGGLNKATASQVDEGALTVLYADYGGEAFKEVFRPEKSDIAVYEINQPRLARTIYGVYISGVR